MSLMDAYIVASGMRQSHNADLKNLDEIMQAGIERITELKDEVRKLQLALAIEQAHTAGLEAQLGAYKAKHADSALLQKTDQRFKENDERKTVGRLIYEKAFDAKAKELKIADPTEVRAD